jgi:DNA-binding Lrp family transcriptional regulator
MSVGVAGTVGLPTLEKADPAKTDATRSVALVTTSRANSRSDSELPDLEAMYEVTGEFDIVCLVSANNIEVFRDLPKNRIVKIRGVKSIKSSVILYSHRCLKRN